MCFVRLTCLLVATLPLAAAFGQSGAEPLALNPGDRIAIVGNSLADRMQHHGWLETYLHARYPAHQLVVRNLAVTGDEVATRARSQNFGSPDEWLTRVGAEVVFAFFGFNESFQGPDGLARFRAELDRFLSETRARNYGGGNPPRIVLFSPIANENHPDSNFAVPAENNRNLALYTAAMAEVAADRAGVTFIDLFTPSQQLFAQAAREGRALTHNGLHLTEEGASVFAPVIFEQLVGEPAPGGNLARLRAAVNEKNAMWHSRYRTVDGYNVYGGRSSLAFPSIVEGERITNFDVMQEEMTQRDIMTANRDRRVWAVAQGSDLVVEDRDLPPTTPVPTNLPGPNPDGSFDFLSAEEAISRMTVHPGLQVNLFASEAEFPELANPVQMAWDTRGRLWVSTWPNYPSRRPDSAQGDRLIILEDTDADGRADKRTVFLDDLNAPTGFQFYRDGVLVVQAPDLWWVRDTDGDDRGDYRERILMGLDSADSHHTSNSLVLDPGGAIYLSDGVFHRTQVETARGPVRNIDGAIYRFEPQTGKFETYVSYGFANPHGRTFDRWGNDLITDATSNSTYFGPAFSGRIDYPQKHPRMNTIWDRPARPSAGGLILTSRHFPEEFQGNFLNGNVIGFQGFWRVGLHDEGSGIRGDRLTDLLSSSDPNFRPLEINVGPDGAMYFLDWHNPIIGHMQHHLRDPNRDARYGRIYRLSAKDRPVLVPPKIHGEPIQALLELLKEHENHVRQLAKIELGKRDSDAVIAAVNTWIAGLDRAHPDYEHHLMEALWVHQWHNRIDADLLRRMLRSPEAHARAAATRVLSYWRDRVPDALALLAVQARDEHPRVRLQAVRAASFFRETEAVDVALAITGKPTDYYLEYTLEETVKQLRPQWRESLNDPRTYAIRDAAEIEYLVRAVPVDELPSLPKSRVVLEHLVSRVNVPEIARQQALQTLADNRGHSPARVLLDLLDAPGARDEQSMARMLTARPAAELAEVRSRLAALAADTSSPVRAHGWAALVLADQSFDALWAAAEQAGARQTLLEAIPLIPDPALRAQSFTQVHALVQRSAQRAPDAADPDGALLPAAMLALVSSRQQPETVFPLLAAMVEHGRHLPAAAQAIRALPATSWEPARAFAVATTLIGWARDVPPRQRNERDYLETVQAAEALLAVAPAADAAPLRRELHRLRVATFIVRAVPEQMRFDLPRIVVEAGTTFRLMVENPDAMPHNLVVVTPGSREKVGTAAQLMAPEQVDSEGRAYVPDLPEVLGATRLLESGQSATLTMRAPTTEGVYEYVCTFPGHWIIMYGRLVVTKDVAAYLEQSPPPAPVPAAAALHSEH